MVPKKHLKNITHFNPFGMSLMGCFLNLKIKGVDSIVFENDLNIEISSGFIPVCVIILIATIQLVIKIELIFMTSIT